MSQIQCCVDVACRLTNEDERYGYCVNSEKECFKTVARPYVPEPLTLTHIYFGPLINMGSSGSCPTPNTKCCAKDVVADDSLPDGIEDALLALEKTNSNWDQFDPASTFSFDNPDEESGNLALSTFGGDEQLFSNVSPDIDLFDDGDQMFNFEA